MAIHQMFLGLGAGDLPVPVEFLIVAGGGGGGKDRAGGGGAGGMRGS